MAIHGDGTALLRVHDKAWLSKSGQPGQFELATESEDQLIPGHSATTSNGWVGVVATMERRIIGTLATADRLAVRINDAEVGAVDLNGLSQPMIGLQNCANKLPPATSHVVKAPELISNLDAMDFQTGGRHLRPLVFRLSVDAQGKVGGCEIVQSSGSSEVDETTCSMMQRQAQFRPAIDSDGNAAASTYERRIIF
jgi:TonB family protein